jgi:chemotaxis protein MotB
MKKALLLGAVAVFLAGCGISEKVYKADVNGLKDQIATLEQNKEQLIGEKRKLSEELLVLGKEKGALSGDLKKALDRVEELRLMAEKRKAKLMELRNKLQAMVAAGQLKIRTDKGRIIVEMAEKVLFDVGKFKLKPEGLTALSQLTTILMSLEARQFQVAGHTDDTGSDETNWKLSANRALEVVLYMIEQGMPANRISASGYGKFAPVAPNDTPEGRTQNRRIEIVLVPDITELLTPEGE